MSEHTTEKSQKNSQLIASLREGVAVVQMILYKSVREQLVTRYPHRASNEHAMLAGAIINEIFGTPNPGPQFVAFKKENWSTIEQELLALKENNQHVVTFLTDALRIQVLCDSQQSMDSSSTLIAARNYGYLIEEREVPLPSTFMTLIRSLGEKNGLIIAPVQITSEQDQAIVH